VSTCISRHGEFGSHQLVDYVCTLCGVLDEDAMVGELQQMRAELATLTAERDRAAIDAELLGIGRALNALDSDATEMLLIEHQRLDIGNCRCGWGVNTGQLGRSHSKHVLDAISSAVRETVYAPESGQERDALAARLAQAERVVEAARAMAAYIHEVGEWRCSAGERVEEHLAAVVAAVDALDGTAGPGEEGRSDG
jgi:hypothetical protein